MIVSSINTAVCIAPTETVDKPTYTIKHNESELSTTVENENLAWRFNKVIKDTKLLESECAQLCDSALRGYNAAYFSLSVSDGHRREMNKQREQTMKLFFETLTTMMENSTDNYEIEYAFLGIQNGLCYDIRENIIRTEESMKNRDIDSIMKQVDCIDVIFKLIEGRATPLPHLISIKFTNPNTRAVGRLVLIDLMYSPFTPFVRDSTVRVIEYTMSVLALAKRTEFIPLEECFMSKEIIKYICGHNQLMMVLYLNDRIINEDHFKDTLHLLSLVFLFTDMPVRSFPNAIKK